MVKGQVPEQDKEVGPSSLPLNTVQEFLSGQLWRKEGWTEDGERDKMCPGWERKRTLQDDMIL